jgi:hypothetical protein
MYNNAQALPAKYADHGTPELQAKAMAEYNVTEEGYKQARVTNQTAVQMLYKLKLVSEQQYLAACKLQLAYLSSRLTIDIRSRSIVELTQNSNNYRNRMIDYCHLDSKKKFDQAMSILDDHDRKNGSYYRKLVEHVVLEGGYLKQLKRNQLYKDAKLEHLREALDILALYYGIVRKTVG